MRTVTSNPDGDTTTSHMACGCPCGARFVIATLPMPMDAAAKRMQRATCPDCGNTEGLFYALNDDHRAAVRRLREEAAKD